MSHTNATEAKIIIAIDGHSGCGKSTLAKDLSKQLSYIHIDTGAMYRSIALHTVRENIPIANTDSIIQALSSIQLELKFEDGASQVYLNGEPVVHLLKDQAVVDIVSEVAAIEEVRSYLMGIQRQMGKEKGIVMDGRDIGTIIFPEAELKLFVTADLDMRTERRVLELQQRGIARDADIIRANLEKRDLLDSTREVAPLVKADDAIVIDTTNLTREEQTETAVQLVREITSQVK